jgi:hypothetical protein
MMSAAPPSALPGISPTRGESGQRLVHCLKEMPHAELATVEDGEAAPHPLSPLVGEMPGRAEGGKPRANLEENAC